MGDVSIIARRLESGTRVQYGWSGNGGYFKMVGSRLLDWYNSQEKVEYLFNLGQLSILGKPGSENGGAPMFFTTELTNKPHWLGTSECDIFSKIVFVDYGYFYDLDNTWYYIIPKPFRIKIPLSYIEQNLDEKGFEFDEREKIASMVTEYILFQYYSTNSRFQKFVKKQYPQGIDKIRSDVFNSNDNTYSVFILYGKYDKILDYFDDWIVARTNIAKNQITGFLLKKKQKKERLETIYW